MNDLILLKRTYPISKFNRFCDGFFFIKKNFTDEELKKMGINPNKIQRIIKEGEKYIYQVAKDGKEFKTLSLSFHNFELIRKHIFKFDD